MRSAAVARCGVPLHRKPSVRCGLLAAIETDEAMLRVLEGDRHGLPGGGGRWRSGAAYLYILRLNSQALAWEYLRRNPDYRAAWRGSRTAAPAADQWNLAQLENPAVDGLRARPLWRTSDGHALRILAATPTTSDALPFELWKLAGQKALVHDGHVLKAWVLGTDRTLLLTLDLCLADGDPFEYLVPSGPLLADACATAHLINTRFSVDRQHAQALRTSVAAAVHLRSLQALDGAQAGASQREIATALYGVARVQRDWTPDGDLRARTRYCIRRARALMAGGYRSLLGAPQGQRRGSADSPCT